MVALFSRLANRIDRVRRAVFLLAVDETLGNRIRGEQIRSVLRLTPLTLFSNLFNTGVMVYALVGEVSSLALALWAIPIVVVSVIPIRGWLSLQKRGSSQSASQRSINRLTRNAAILSVLWGALTVSFFPQVDAQHQLLIAGVISGMMFGGAFVLAAVPAAAIVYVLILTIASLVPLLRSDNAIYYLDLASLLITYSGVLVVSVLLNSRVFVNRLLADAARERQSQWIQLLLRDFEQDASDWLWQTDASGCLVYASFRFAKVLGRSVEALHNAKFGDLIDPSRNEALGQEASGHDSLKRAMEAKTTFHDLIIPFSANSEQRWWSLIGKPIFDDEGLFAGYRGVGRDITVEKRLEAERRRTQTFLNTVIENIPATIVVKDVRERRYVLMNRAGEKLLGISSGDVLGKGVGDIFSKEQADDFQAQDDELVKSHNQFVVEERALETPHNGIRVVSSQVIGIPDQNGDPEFILRVLEDITERKRVEARIAYLARNDPLTDLPNRATFNEHLVLTIDNAQSTSTNFALYCLDLDRFKEVNDAHGHPVGDELLCAVVRRLRTAAEGVFLARLGGDEFGLITADTTQESAAALADRLLASIAQDFKIDEHQIRLGLSIGVAIYPTDGKDVRTLLSHADAALYRAKADGRQSIRFFDADMDLQLRERRTLQSDLRLSAETGHFILHYQPIAQIAGNVTGFEALLRWPHPTRGLLPPGAFIKLAEESGLIVSIGEWALSEACREAASWPNPLQIAVNISAIQFRSGNLPRMVHSILIKTGLAPRRLVLEITESVLIDDYSLAQSILRQLKSLGIQIALDDFGTGYSSLSYLQSFPFDKIKIDHSFVSSIDRSVQSATIVSSVINLAKGLKIPVVAEGVENEAQLKFLEREACDELQGYLIGRPLPIIDHANLVGRKTMPQELLTA